MDTKYLNREDLVARMTALFRDDTDPAKWEEISGAVEDYIHTYADTVCDDFDDYVSGPYYEIAGSVMNIQDDFNFPSLSMVEKEPPKGPFYLVIDSINDGTISQAKLQAFQEWALEWAMTFAKYRMLQDYREYIKYLD